MEEDINILKNSTNNADLLSTLDKNMVRNEELLTETKIEVEEA